jgi:hypothetical protein
MSSSIHGDRGPAGQAAELLDGLRLDLVPVHRAAVAVRHEHDEAVVRNAGEHALDDAARLVHARHDDDQLRFHGP